MWGQYIMWNRYCIDDPVGWCNGSSNPRLSGGHGMPFNLMTITTTNALRQFIPANPAKDPFDVYSYALIPSGSTGMTSRRVVFQLAHDFNWNGNIQDEFGHMYNGLQVIDSNRNVRGFAMADASFEPPNGLNKMMMMGAMFALDDNSAAAQTGIEDPYNW
jgi:hypothetical protein